MDEPTAVEQILAELVARHGGLTPAQLCRACTQIMDIDGMSLAMISGRDVRETLGAEGRDALKIDQLQFALGEGPCLEACSTRRPVLVPDLERKADDQWPIFAEVVTEIAPHLRAIFGFPLMSGDRPIGAMNLYRDRPGDLTEKEIHEAERACALAVATLTDRLPAGADGDLDDYLDRYAIIDRTAVYQATGLLMTEHGLTAANAFARLQAFAFSHGRPVEDIADDLVNHRLRLPQDSPSPD